MDMNMSRPDNATLLMLRDPAIAVVLPVVYSLVALVSIPGNLFSLWVLCRHIGPKTPSVIFMINLSVTDLMLASVLPFQIYYHCNGNHWVFGELLCNVVTVAFYANMYSSILTMTCISVDRFLDLTYTVHALGIVTCFDVLKSTMLPSVATWAVFLFTLFIVLFLIPFVVTVACYTATILTLLRTPEHPEGQGQRRRAVGLAAVVLLAFVTCFAPNNFVLLVHMVSRLFLGHSYYHVYKLTLCLSCLNNCLDPFVYYFASHEFQLRLRGHLGYGALMEPPNLVVNSALVTLGAGIQPDDLGQAPSAPTILLGFTGTPLSSPFTADERTPSSAPYRARRDTPISTSHAAPAGTPIPSPHRAREEPLPLRPAPHPGNPCTDSQGHPHQPARLRGPKVPCGLRALETARSPGPPARAQLGS
uniref:P2Y purinoceptor 8 n=1 Tax=Camelus bactrianus TaxID=9837 RepID=A0A9W3F7M3_CAMBA|nr:P2Y purinoceptor 8 [Camelus bactrianus]